VSGEIRPINDEKLTPQDTYYILEKIYSISTGIVTSMDKLKQNGEDDFSFSLTAVGRFRVNAYYQRGSVAAVLRVVRFQLPDPKDYHIPSSVIDLAKLNKGLVIVTGATGSGKSTTLACIVDEINRTQNYHIITIEDPIEYLHRHQRSIVSQREVGHDTSDYLSALRAALREAPNVILVGEMRDLETVSVALNAAETGHLVLSTLHTLGASETISRIIDIFPPNQQEQIRVQLTMSLQAVVSQQLLQSKDGGMVPCFEIMKSNPAIRTQIRDNKLHLIDNTISSNRDEGMISMDDSILELYKAGMIDEDTALQHANNKELLKKKM
jgi:twitching motility protein PilT